MQDPFFKDLMREVHAQLSKAPKVPSPPPKPQPRIYDDPSRWTEGPVIVLVYTPTGEPIGCFKQLFGPHGVRRLLPVPAPGDSCPCEYVQGTHWLEPRLPAVEPVEYSAAEVLRMQQRLLELLGDLPSEQVPPLPNP